MRTILMTSAAALAVVLVAAPAAAQNRGEKIAGSYICVLKERELSRGQEQQEAEKAARDVGGKVKHVYSAALKGFAIEEGAPGNSGKLKQNNPKIDYCEEDQVVTAGPVQMQGRPEVGIMAEETPWGIARVGGGAPYSGSGTAWVIDTGIAPHADLNFDTSRSRSFIRDSSPIDQNGHGTHVAGTIAARSNGSGVVGVAAGAPVVAVRVLDRRGSGSNSGVIAGVDYVAQNGRPGDVANMSLGGGVSDALDQAVVRAAAGGVRFALAAGNESDNANNHSPARANGNNVFTVSAFAVGDKWASFSNFGNPPIDYAEPGVAIKSTWLNGGYNTISGTSMATPHLAGLLLSGAVRAGGSVAGDPAAPADVIGVK